MDEKIKNLMYLKRGFVINKTGFMLSNEIRSITTPGQQIFIDINDAVESFELKRAKELNKSIHGGSYYSAMNYNNDVFTIVEVELPNCWMYDTEPIGDGTSYAIKISIKGNRLLEYDEHDFCFKRIEEV